MWKENFCQISLHFKAIVFVKLVASYLVSVTSSFAELSSYTDTAAANLNVFFCSASGLPIRAPNSEQINRNAVGEF